MNLDSPEDRAHTLLRGGGVRRPPARARRARRHGHRRGARLATRSRGFFDELVPARHAGAGGGRATSSTPRSWPWPRPRSARSPAAGVARAPGAGRGRPDGGRRPRRHRAGPPLPRLAQPDGHDPDRCALAVANQVLGGGMASRLFQEVREERGLAYAVYSHPSAYTDAGYLTVYCGTAPKRARETLARDRRGRGVAGGRRHHRRASSRSPPATSRGRCCSGSRTAAAAWPASGEAWCSRARP